MNASRTNWCAARGPRGACSYTVPGPISNSRRVVFSLGVTIPPTSPGMIWLIRAFGTSHVMAEPLRLWTRLALAIERHRNHGVLFALLYLDRRADEGYGTLAALAEIYRYTPANQVLRCQMASSISNSISILNQYT